MDFYFKIETIDDTDIMHCKLINVEFVPDKLMKADIIKEDITNLEELDFFIMDDGFSERDTHMLADLIGIKGNGENMVTLYFKVAHVVDQDDGTVYRDVLYTETFPIDKIRWLFEDYIESYDANSILKYINRSFILYIEYRFTESSIGDYVTKIWTDKLILL